MQNKKLSFFSSLPLCVPSLSQLVCPFVPPFNHFSVFPYYYYCIFLFLLSFCSIDHLQIQLYIYIFHSATQHYLNQLLHQFILPKASPTATPTLCFPASSFLLLFRGQFSFSLSFFYRFNSYRIGGGGSVTD